MRLARISAISCRSRALDPVKKSAAAKPAVMRASAAAPSVPATRRRPRVESRSMRVGTACAFPTIMIFMFFEGPGFRHAQPSFRHPSQGPEARCGVRRPWHARGVRARAGRPGSKAAPPFTRRGRTRDKACGRTRRSSCLSGIESGLGQSPQAATGSADGRSPRRFGRRGRTLRRESGALALRSRGRAWTQAAFSCFRRITCERQQSPSRTRN